MVSFLPLAGLSRALGLVLLFVVLFWILPRPVCILPQVSRAVYFC